MRSVIFHLIEVTHQVVAEKFAVLATLNEPYDGWCLPRDSPEPVLYFRFYDELLSEVEPADLEALTTALGKMPTVSVIVNVSGRVPGEVEVLEFAEFMLTKFRGVAWDEYTSHCWTLSEIRSGAKISGHPFFDYRGWHNDSNH